MLKVRDDASREKCHYYRGYSMRYAGYLQSGRDLYHEVLWGQGTSTRWGGRSSRVSLSSSSKKGTKVCA